MELKNYIGGVWRHSAATEFATVSDPATGEVLAKTPLSPPSEVDMAATIAAEAFVDWRRTPPVKRIQPLFKLKALMEDHFDGMAEMIVLENGKTIGEARGEIRRAIENVEVACGIPLMMQGAVSEDIARGIDEFMIRQPVGVVAIVAPFNFPGMIPFWFLPYAVATGNTVIMKPSERTPLTMQMGIELMEAAGFPRGVVNMVHGGAETVNAILDHPTIKAVSFVGSTAVAKHIYARAAANGKRVQAQGGAKNPLLIMPDADVEMTTKIVTDSVFGNSGQRCLAASNIILVGAAKEIFTPLLQKTAVSRVLGHGLDDGVEMGPVISGQSKERISGLIEMGVREGAELLVDGRSFTPPSALKEGHFLAPTILDNVAIDGELSRTEIFGPVMSLMHAADLDEAIAWINSGQYGNMASLFTTSGGVARRFRYEAQAGNIGINIGVAAPMAFFPFSGWKDSFFGTLHAQSGHGVEFYTQTKIVVERWLKEWSRQF